MNNYRIGFSVIGFINIEANNQQKAEEKFRKLSTEFLKQFISGDPAIDEVEKRINREV